MNNFKDIKKGDKVIVVKGEKEIATNVDFVSDSHIIVEGMEYKRDNGRQDVPNGFLHYYLKIVDEYDWRMVKDNNIKELIISVIREEKWEAYSLKELNAVCAVINFIRK